LEPLSLPAFAKINLDLRILGLRGDGYHDVRTILQTLALHDTLTFVPREGAFTIQCDDAEVPTDRRNLVWHAAALLWKTAGKRRGNTPRDALVQIEKRIPPQAGLGGGSADAAVALLGLARLWELSIDTPTINRLAAAIGSDVPFFLFGGTALGLGRGDDIYPLTDLPRSSVVIIRPRFGVATTDAYEWFDSGPRASARGRVGRSLPHGWPEWARNLRNDLERPVIAHHPTIGRIKAALLDAGAVFAAMSGSGSTVFGLFERPEAAARTARDLARPGWHIVATRTLDRADYARRLPVGWPNARRSEPPAPAPALAGGRKRRIS
jgi:4-diphosphocytidyl-2-C-methyl-D-erythritol kinase